MEAEESAGTTAPRGSDEAEADRQRGQIADSLDDQAEHLGERANELQGKADALHARAETLGDESQGLHRLQEQMHEQAKHLREETGSEEARRQGDADEEASNPGTREGPREPE